MGVLSLGLVLVAVPFVIYVWLNARERKRAEQGLPRHGGIRLAFASLAALIVLFSGGCGGLFLGSWVMDGMRSNDYVGFEAIAVFSLPPIAVGALIWWLAMMRPKS